MVEKQGNLIIYKLNKAKIKTLFAKFMQMYLICIIFFQKNSDKLKKMVNKRQALVIKIW